MKVYELIELLKAMPQDMEVVRADGQNAEPIQEVYVQKAVASIPSMVVIE